MTSYIRTSILILAIALASQTLLAQRAARIDSITPAAARVGDIVTINGNGYGALNVRVTVGGINAAVLTANGNQVTFRVPERVRAGLTQVAAVNPGGQTGAIPFRVLDGILLSGNPNTPIVDAVTNMPPVPADERDIRDGVIMSRLDLYLSPRATVGQVNAALRTVNGGIITMLRREPVVTIAIPPAADIDALLLVVNKLNALRGVVSRAIVARVSASKELPPVPDDAVNAVRPLVPARFPAAWNASHLATDGCEGRKVNVLVPDRYAAMPSGFADEVPDFQSLGDFGSDSGHGYDVATTLAAQFNQITPTGASPFPGCLTISGLGVSRESRFQDMALIISNFPAGKFLMNFSQGYFDTLLCLPCTPSHVYTYIDFPLDRAYEGAEWTRLTRNRWNDFVSGVAAGNERDILGTEEYAGLGVAAFDSYMSVVTLPNLLSFQQDEAQWNPRNTPTLPSLVTDSGELSAFSLYLQDIGLDAIPPAGNVLLVGSATPGLDAQSLSESSSSDSGADVFAVGEDVPLLINAGNGTSFSAPQVTGLAAYLWLLSGGAHAKAPGVEDLSTQPASVTRRAILQNTRSGQGVNLLDAYAAALSLDAAALPTPDTAPVRLALLNLDNSSRFDELDLAGFVGTYFDAEGELLEPLVQDYGRMDLNGDGFTGGSKTARFDLDRVGSTQFGAASYSTVLQNIGGDVSFEEGALTDHQILCYYAYSELYKGNPDTRDDLLANLCATITIDVAPATVDLQAGATQQFAATVKGTPNANVTWTATGGTITSTGLFTAGPNGGTFKVRATSVADAEAFGEASVNVSGGSGGGLSVPLAQAKTHRGGSLAFCLPGPTNAPNSDKSPFGLDRSMDAPNVGPLTTGSLLSAPVTKSANCQQSDGAKNVAEVTHTLTASSGSAAWDVYVSSDKSAANMEGLAVVQVKMPVAGIATVTMNSGWIKGLSTSTGTGTAGVGVFSTIHNDSLFCQFLRGTTESTPVTSCTGPTTLTLTLNKDDVIVLSGSIVRAGEGSGRLFTLTFTPSP